MPITISRAATADIAASNLTANYPNSVVVDFGRPKFHYQIIKMRELIHWTAYRLEGEDGNHRTASLLRAVAEQFYPNSHDGADWILDELQDQGIEIDFDFEEMSPPTIDMRLLGLVDGFALIGDTFAEPLWTGETPTPALARNAANYLDFEFPDGAFEQYGIRGIRVYCLDLIHWIQSSTDLLEMAYQSEDAWLDAWEQSHERMVANAKYRGDLRRRARYGDDFADDVDGPESEGTADIATQDTILTELAGLV